MDLDLTIHAPIDGVVITCKVEAGQTVAAILVDGKIYVPNQAGDVFVLRASPKFELLATNSVNEPTNASLAASDRDLFLRTSKSLWCFNNAQ